MKTLLIYFVTSKCSALIKIAGFTAINGGKELMSYQRDFIFLRLSVEKEGGRQLEGEGLISGLCALPLRFANCFRNISVEPKKIIIALHTMGFSCRVKSGWPVLVREFNEKSREAPLEMNPGDLRFFLR